MSLRLRLLELLGGWLLDLGRWVITRLGDLGSRIRALDDRRLSLGVVVFGSALASLSVLLGGFFGAPGPVVRPLYVLAALLPLIGVGIGLYAIRLASRIRSRTPESSPDRLAVAEPSRTGDAVDSGMERQLSTATEARYGCRPTIAARGIRAELSEGAVRALRTRHGRSPSAAREAVRTGTWTDDPVAAAFLAEESGLPIAERVRTAVDPGGAYRRRVRRTVAAIESLDPAASTSTEEVEP